MLRITMASSGMFDDLEAALKKFGYVLISADERQEQQVICGRETDGSPMMRPVGRTVRTLTLVAVHAFVADAVKGSAMVRKR